MQTVLIVFHLMVVIGLVATVLLQRSEGGALGVGGGGGFMTGRGQANALTRATAILGTLFFFQAPSISSGIFGGAASGGHNFLAVGANQIIGRMNRARMPRSASARVNSGGSISRGVE